ncbi:Pentatricopeptide repeat-containing protein [Thalictrum thalictroides]|uniref:Pentatricopeptide repeat-containing protein n=1 Tax=Thalictrum thalictroides TaxID=46969 RepID=A0A7J6WLX5_THATH|nr:Pentatricopeptide repeat-containing protein [Thalictrum thalictroides]
MRASNCIPNNFTIPMVVSSSAELLDLEHGKCVHSLGLKLCLFEGNTAVGSSFVYMYSKSGKMKDACRVFDEMTMRDVVAWTALVVGYVQNDENEMGLSCFCEMHRIGENPNFRTIEGGLQACGNMAYILSGRCLHGYALKTGNGDSQFVRSSLLLMYSKCESIKENYLAFCELPYKDRISWTVIIGVYARSGYISECLQLFWEMQGFGIDPDAIVMSCMLACFGNVGRVYESKAFHGQILRRNYEYNKMVTNSLLSMYCKCDCLDHAEKLFGELHERDTESWNCMISGYSRMGLVTKCIEKFREMQYEGIESDTSSIAVVISSCSRIAALHLGRSVHCHVIKSKTEKSISITNSLLGMYGRFRNLATAEKIFCREHKDIVTWNTIMSAYTNNGLYIEALGLFDQMVLGELKPNSVTMVIILSACSHLADLYHGERVHTYIKSICLKCDLSVSTGLIDMYVKCGQLRAAREIFDSILNRDVVLWNVMISGYGIHGDAKSAVEIFQQMEASDVRPNGLSFLAVLSACNHSGLVEEGKYLFSRMRDYFVVPTLKHYACMVDLLGRSGNLHDAEAMVRSMPITPDGGMWGALLGACKIHNDVEMGERIAKQAIESDPENDGYYIILSNLYNSVGKWEEAEMVRQLMKTKGVKKRAGWSIV